MTEDQPRGLRIACDLPDDIRSRVQRAFHADTDGHVQNEQVGAAGEFGKAGIGASLIRPEHDGAITDPDPVGQRRDVSMRHAKRGHDQAIALQNGGGLPGGGINDDDVERRDATDTSECRSQHSECACLLIEQLQQEGSKRGNIGIPRRASDGKRGLPDEIAPKQGWQIGNMIRMEMTDGNQRKVVEAPASLGKTEKGASPRVHENPAPSIEPNQVACRSRRAIRLDAGTVGTQYLQRDAIGLTGLSGGSGRIDPPSKRHENRDLCCAPHGREA